MNLEQVDCSSLPIPIDEGEVAVEVEVKVEVEVEVVGGREDLVVAMTGSHLAVKGLYSDGWQTIRFEADVSAIGSFTTEILLVGLASGELVAIELPMLDVRWRIRIRDGSPIRQIQREETLLCLLVGSETESVLAAFYAESVMAAIEGGSGGGTLREAGCYYELPHGRVTTFHLVDAGQRRRRGWMDGWPEGSERAECARIVIGGMQPMFAIYELSPVSEALPDPVGLAAEYISNTVGSWWKRPAKAEERNLLDRLPMGQLKPVLTLDDADRTISRLWPHGSNYVLFDAHYGRALLFDPTPGIIRRQIKGLRGCAVSCLAKGSNGNEDKSPSFLVALHPKRGYVDTIDLSLGEVTDRLDLPQVKGALTRWRLLPSRCCSPLVGAISPEGETPRLALYKLTR